MASHPTRPRSSARKTEGVFVSGAAGECLRTAAFSGAAFRFLFPSRAERRPRPPREDFEMRREHFIRTILLACVRTTLFAFALALACAGHAHAQRQGATISGHVTD